MKHLWFGVGLLASLLAVSLWLGSTLEEFHRQPAQDLEKAADAAMAEDWPLASALYLRAKKHWDSHRNLSAALVHHDPVEQVDAGFALLELYAACEDESAFITACTQQAQNLRALHQPHSFRWWNLL